jgi:hypothetical protein
MGAKHTSHVWLEEESCRPIDSLLRILTGKHTYQLNGSTSC